MKYFNEHILKGFGRILDIWPATDYTEYTEEKEPRDQIIKAWQQAGDSMRAAIGYYKNVRTEDRREEHNPNH